jgi:hypothetical protein
MRRAVSLSADVAVIALLAFLGWRFFENRMLASVSSPKAGMSIDLGSPPSPPRDQIVMLLSDRCSYCDASIEPLKRVLRMFPDARSVALFPGSEAAGREYLDRQSLAVSEIRGFAKVPWRLVKSPTVILCDGEGKVVAAWEGLVSPDAEKDLVRVARSRLGGTPR